MVKNAGVCAGVSVATVQQYSRETSDQRLQELVSGLFTLSLLSHSQFHSAMICADEKVGNNK